MSIYLSIYFCRRRHNDDDDDNGAVRSCLSVSLPLAVD